MMFLGPPVKTIFTVHREEVTALLEMSLKTPYIHMKTPLFCSVASQDVCRIATPDCIDWTKNGLNLRSTEYELSRISRCMRDSIGTETCSMDHGKMDKDKDQNFSVFPAMLTRNQRCKNQEKLHNQVSDIQVDQPESRFSKSDRAPCDAERFDCHRTKILILR